MFKLLENNSEKIVICANNAGIASLTPIFVQEESNSFEEIVNVNLIGIWYVKKQLQTI